MRQRGPLSRGVMRVATRTRTGSCHHEGERNATSPQEPLKKDPVPSNTSFLTQLLHTGSRCFSNFFLFLPQGLCTCFSLCLEHSFLRYPHLRSSFSWELCPKEASPKAGLALSPPTFISLSPLPLSEHFCLLFVLLTRKSTVLKLMKLKTKFMSPPFISLWMVKGKEKKIDDNVSHNIMSPMCRRGSDTWCTY